MRYLATAVALFCGLGLACSDGPVVLGPLEEIALIEDFTADRAQAWRPRSGSNVAVEVQCGAELPGVAQTLLAVTMARRDPADTEPGNNWLAVDCTELPAGRVPPDADGFRFLIGSRVSLQQWVQVVLTTEKGARYSRVIADHTFPAGRIVEHTVPLAEFVDETGRALTPEEAATVRGLSFILSAQPSTFYVDRVSAYRQERLSSWLEYGTSMTGTNLFERGEPVRLIFTVGGARPEGATGFRWEVRDYWGQVTGGGRVAFTDAASYTVSATPGTHGYYEVTAHFLDAAGRDTSERSCLRAEGTVPVGLGTFAVLPVTVEENLARFRKLGDRAFFGLHGDFLDLADHVGLAWRFDYRNWFWTEPERPDRSEGIAPWARELLNGSPQPDYRLHILPFLGNLRDAVPQWARREGPEAPPFANWEDYLALVRDCVRVEKHLYPHQKPRLYGGAWEINLNMPPYVSNPPEHTPEQVVELFRRTREVVKAEDPDGLVLGPCPSTLDLEWFERVFRAGVLEYLDGIETHGYLSGVYRPEENDFPGKLARLRALVRRYKGRELPIYVTEAGIPGADGAEVVHRSQAERLVRMAIILKGEGVRVFLPFYGLDYDRMGAFGFFFNLDVDPPAGPWHSKRVSPKPLVNAMATCVQMLEGTNPRRRLRDLGDDVWAYAFAREGKTVTAVWTAAGTRRVALPVARERTVEIVDFMGHGRRVAVSDGRVQVEAGEAPVYVVY